MPQVKNGPPPEQGLSVPEQLLTQGAAIIRVENETQVQMALRHPRDPDQIIEKCSNRLKRSPRLAETAQYAIPYAEKRGSSKRVWVKGPTIDFAVFLASKWGNCADGARVVQADTEEHNDIAQGLFIDYESNRRVTREKFVSRFARRDGNLVRLDPVTYGREVEIAMSKAHRNAILKGVDADVVEEVYEVAVAVKEGKIGSEKMKPSEAFEALVGIFAQHKVTREMLLQALEKSEVGAVTAEDIGNLKGLLKAIQSNLIDISSLEKSEPQPEDSLDKEVQNGAVKVTEKVDMSPDEVTKVTESVAKSLSGDPPHPADGLESFNF